jgi:hypothetical protein
MERRRDERIETNLHVTCRVPARPRSALMHDLSHTGCRLEFRERDVARGGTVLVEPPGVQQISGQVVWTNGCQVGVQFDSWLGSSESVALGLDAPEPEPEPVANEHAEDEKRMSGLLRNLRQRLGGNPA